MTIFALSSGKGRAGVSIIRVSGPATKQAILSLTATEILPVERMATLRWFYHPLTHEKIDQGIVVFFPGPKSFTGEDVAEFHIHGGNAVIEQFLTVLSGLPNLRMAEAGEFTRRAFDNDKMDLTAVEGLSDLINSETEGQRKQALRQMQGSLAHLYEEWRSQLITAMAYLEADIDFSEEEIPDDVAARVRPIIEKLKTEISGHLADGHRGEILRHGLDVVILGAPNSGKSTLLNFLSKRDVAIVSDIAGTTRDLLEVHLNLAGIPVNIVDTAGLRDSSDRIEAEGMRRAIERARQADLKLVIIDGTEKRGDDNKSIHHIDNNTMVLINKRDLRSPGNSEGFDSYQVFLKNCLGVWHVSVKMETGLDTFLKALETEVIKRIGNSDSPVITRTRHRLYLQSAVDHVCRFLDSDHFELELLSEDLRMAARDIGRITGLVDVEDILEKIFKEFCIGK